MAIVIINGRKFDVADGVPLSFRDVADIAKKGTGTLTMTVCEDGGHGGTVQPGQSVLPRNGMVFNVYDTSNA
jgi:hypothetical protein